MNKNAIFACMVLVMLAFWLAACGSNEPDIPEDAVLILVGNVEQEVGWAEESIKSMETMEVESINSKGETDIYTGVSIISLVEKASVKPDANTIIFFADDDGTSGEIPLVDLLSCENCIVSFRAKGGFSIIAPDLGKDAQVKGVVRIEVK